MAFRPCPANTAHPVKHPGPSRSPGPSMLPRDLLSAACCAPAPGTSPRRLLVPASCFSTENLMARVPSRRHHVRAPGHSQVSPGFPGEWERLDVAGSTRTER
ncbi:hypothetical protein OH76DRAFT_1008425 [Lentinus brumalis]|uniref:Uncharacterized protein n=1 Tax=Lentinus brumalis TaxID=2498619 RepID=A0A371CYA5_9APHY|nr:hypothetical protein OH76DRAFT_1008425 [Polyporus brumalis]